MNDEQNKGDGGNDDSIKKVASGSKTSSLSEQRGGSSHTTISSIDQDIAAKQKGRSTGTTPAKPGAYTATSAVSSSDGNEHLRGVEADILAKQRGSSSHTTISSIDQDIAAKQKGRSIGTTPAKPGAYTATSAISSSDGNEHLRGVEADILAKQRGSSLHTTISSIDQDIAAKQKGRSIGTTPVKPGAYTATSAISSSDGNEHLRGVEADILAKQRGSSSHTTISSIDQDIAAKQKGRSIGTTPAKPGAYTATSAISSSDGNEHLRGVEADILAKQRGSSSHTTISSIDQDIAAKQKGRSIGTTPVKPGAYTATSAISSSDGNEHLRGVEADILAKQRGSSSHTTISSIDQDIAAKQKGRSIGTTPVKPGAYTATSAISSSDGNEHLRGVEADILAKQRGSSFTTISTIEQDIAAKQKGRSTGTTPVKPGAYTATSAVSSSDGNEHLRGVEADILAKQRGSSLHTTISTIEQDIADKQNGRSTGATPAKPSAYVAASAVSNSNGSEELHGLEADILAKQRGSSFTTISTIEQDIAAKQKGRSTGTTPVKPGAYTATSAVSSSDGNEHLRGVEADILAKQRGSSLHTTISTIEQDIADKQNGRSTGATPAKPGAYVAASAVSNSNGSEELHGLEADILAKQRGSSLHTTIFPIDHQGPVTGSIPVTLRALNANRVIGDDSATKTPLQVATSLSRSDNGITDLRGCLIAPGSDLVLSNMNISKTEQISGDRNDIDTMAAELLELDMEIAARRDALSSFSPHPGPNDATKELNHNILTLVSEEDNKGSTLDLPFKQTSDKAQQRAWTDDNSCSHSNSKNELSHSTLKEENLNGLEYGEHGRDDEEGLAIAFAVDDDDADMYIPSAVEFDPDAKPSMYRNRRFRLYVCLMLTVAVIGAFGAALGIVFTAQEPLPESVPYRLTLGIRDNLALIVSPELLDDFTSPYKKALDWITFTDPLALTPDNSRFLNRYVLAYFYFATSQKKPWISDCAPSESEGDDCVNAFLKDDGLGEGPKFTNKTAYRWLSAIDECQWAGIGCDEFDQIRSISLSYVGMTGSFPEGLTLLPYLQQIDFRFGEVEGSLPAYIDRWKNLVRIRLEQHLFTGSFPESWFGSRSWKELIVVGNQIVGKVASNFSKLEDAVLLDVGINKLTGSIPLEIGNMVNLKYFSVESNELSGSIPNTIGKLSNSLVLRFQDNSLTGTIPKEVGDCTMLQDLYLNSNLLTGQLPEHLWDMSNLYILRVDENMLTGTISGKLSKMETLNELEIKNNQFTGTIPFRLGNTAISIISASGNNFNGTVAQGLCDLVNVGQIDDLRLDCAASLGEVPEIICPEDCCTVCCNRDGEDCVDR